MSRNKILTSIKGYNSVSNLRKMTGNNPNLVNIMIECCFVKFCPFVLKILRGNEIPTFQGP